MFRNSLLIFISVFIFASFVQINTSQVYAATCTLPDGSTCTDACANSDADGNCTNTCFACSGAGVLSNVACGGYSSFSDADAACGEGDPDPDPEPTEGPPPPTFDYVPCEGPEELPEFHSMRPYRASPCNPNLQDLALYCANDMLLVEEFELLPNDETVTECDPDPALMDPAELGALLLSGGSITCRHEIERGSVEEDIPGVEIAVDLTDAELPFMGNTQLVPNQVNDGNPSPENLNYAQRMNHYISWYFNGIPYRAEEEPIDLEDDDDEPPTDVNDGSEILTTFGGPVKKLFPERLQILRREQITNNLGAGANNQHDQIVRCATGALFWQNTVPCTPPTHENDALRLSEAGSLFSNPGEELYVPFSSMEDRLGTFELSLEQTVQPTAEEENDLVFINQPVYIYEEEVFPNAHGFPNVDENTDLLYFSHMLENNQLEDYLQNTYMPHPSNIDESISTGNQNVPGQNYYNTYRCDLENARWNTGDDLLGEANPNDTPAGDVRYSGYLDCDYTVNVENYETCLLTGAEPIDCFYLTAETCEQQSVVAVSAYVRTPLANENWSRLVASDQSFFKRFMPRMVPIDDGTGSIVAELQDLPGVTTGRYTSSTDDIDVYAGNLDRSGDRANVFIPHLGGINEYFQIQIQNALRPQQFHTFYHAGGDEPGSIPPPDPGDISCSIPSSGFCSPDHLMSVVPFDPGQAQAAAAICTAESGGHLGALNDNCLLATDGIDNDGDGCTDLEDTTANGCSTPQYDGAQGDYSVGLFQINLQPWATWSPRCPGAFVDPRANDIPVVGCEIADQDLLDECVEEYMDVANEGENNIRTAFDLANCSTVNGVQQCNWCGNWSTAPICGLCN